LGPQSGSNSVRDRLGAVPGQVVDFIFCNDIHCGLAHPGADDVFFCPGRDKGERKKERIDGKNSHKTGSL
jgi:hypothetical protein